MVVRNKRNKIIMSCLLLLCAVLCVCFLLSEGEIHPENIDIESACAQISEYGVGLFLFEWIMLTLMYGTVFWTALFCISIPIYWGLHRDDKRILDRWYHPPYEDELFFGGYLSAGIGYLFTFLLVLLKYIGVLEIDFF